MNQIKQIFLGPYKCVKVIKQEESVKIKHEEYEEVKQEVDAQIKYEEYLDTVKEDMEYEEEDKQEVDVKEEYEKEVKQEDVKVKIEYEEREIKQEDVKIEYEFDDPAYESYEEEKSPDSKGVEKYREAIRQQQSETKKGKNFVNQFTIKYK